MMTAEEAREKLRKESAIHRHLEEKMTKLIGVAISKGLNYIIYNLAEESEEPYWMRFSRPYSCSVVKLFAEKYGYEASIYSDNKRVQISW